MENMDRRQRKTRKAIFNAFIDLLSKKDVSQITVGQIIKAADVGRATFYAHFETKDFLIKELCEELFCHIFDVSEGHYEHKHIFECEAPEGVFLHLFSHLKKNDNNILSLLSSSGNDLFLSYFKSGLARLIEKEIDSLNIKASKSLPRDFLVNHISSTFVETVRWWVLNSLKETPDEICRYFLSAIGE